MEALRGLVRAVHLSWLKAIGKVLMRMPAGAARAGNVVILCICLAAQLLLTVASAAEPDRKRVLILHSFGQNFRPWGEYAKTIRMELSAQSRWPLIISDHSLVTAQSSEENPEAHFVTFLQSLYAQRPPDVIICLGAPAANFVQRHRAELFPEIPMVLTAVEQRRLRLQSLTSNDAVVAVAHDFPAVFENMLRLLPDTQMVVVVNGSSPNEKFWLSELKRELAPFESRIKLQWFENTPFETILKEAASLPPKTAIFWHLMNVDAAGVAYEGDTGLRSLYAAANAPIFSYDDGFFGQEVVGGPMYSVQDISQKTAAVVVRILAGEKAGDIRVPAILFAPPKYDWRLLQRWSIGEKMLPPGSQIMFREPPAWEKYRGQILIFIAVLLMQSVLISGLIYQRRRRRVAEIHARSRMSELAHANHFQTAGQLATTIAHELNQPLAAILFNIEAIQLILESSSPDVAELRSIAGDIRRDDIRAAEVIRRLRSLLTKAPFELKAIDLNDVVRETLDLLNGLAVSRQVNIAMAKSPVALPIKGDRVQLQQVLINLIVNAVDAVSSKPTAEATRQVTVWTTRHPGQAEVCVLDNGPGIEARKLDEVFQPYYSTKPNGMGMGLSIARTIVESHSGQISAEIPQEGGALFRLRLPLAVGVAEI